MFGNIQHRIKKKEREVQKLANEVVCVEDAFAMEGCRKELSELSLREEILWKQRSKNLWLKEGDRNTKYFHGIASRRRKNNQIEWIKNEEGLCFDKMEEVERIFMDYFENIFTTCNPSNMDKIFQVINTRVTSEMMRLDKEFTITKVKSALF